MISFKILQLAANHFAYPGVEESMRTRALVNQDVDVDEF